MRFVLRREYPDWEGNPRMALHVDEEALLAVKRGEVESFPADVVAELKHPMYNVAGIAMSGMTVFYDL